jgi:DNA-binding beta-propeller fold protein YncE
MNISNANAIADFDKGDRKQVNVSSLKCNNINVNVNGLELDVFPPFLKDDVMEADAAEPNSADNWYSGTEGNDKSDFRNFKYVCINNNNNIVIATEEPEPPIITLYVTNQGDNTVEIYDISSNPTAPVNQGQFNAGNLVFPTGIAIQGTTLYVVNFFTDDNVEIYDISIPTVPVHQGQFGTGDLNNPFGIAIQGTTLYVTNQGDNTVEIYDISIPTVPVNQGQFGTGDLNVPTGIAIQVTTQ